MRVGILAFIFLTPSFVFAAGFAKQSLFLSQATVTEGDTVSVYAVVENVSTQAFSGKLKYLDGETSIGDVPVSLKSGAAAAVSISWTPTAGSHHITANLVNNAGETTESQNAEFFVNETPAPASNNQSGGGGVWGSNAGTSTLESSQPLINWIEDKSPAVAKITTPIFNSIDSGRAAAHNTLTDGSTRTKSVIAKDTKAPGGWLNTLKLMLSTVFLYVLAALTYLVDNIGIFYPFFAILFFYGLWRLYRMARR